MKSLISKSCPLGETSTRKLVYVRTLAASTSGEPIGSNVIFCALKENLKILQFVFRSVASCLAEVGLGLEKRTFLDTLDKKVDLFRYPLIFIC